MQRRTTEQKTTSADSELGWLRSPEEREVFESLDITNAVVFALVMMRNPDLCKRVIEASIGRIVDEVKVVTTEKSIMAGIGSKAVRLDAMALSGSVIFDVEMQVSGADDIARRTRYYHSAIDVEFLGKGDSYSRLPDSYVIFIGATSLLGSAFEPVPSRTFCMVDTATGQPLGDGIATIILDATAWEAADGELRGMLELVRRGNAAAALKDAAGIAAALHGAVERVKESEGDKMIMSAATQMEIMERHIARMEEEIERKDKESLEFSKLIKALLTDKRFEEIEKATDDPELRAQLIREYGIIAS